MGAAYEAPEMTASKLDRAMAENAPYIENINFRGITIPDYLHGRFQHCTFSDCDFSGTEISASFDDCSLYDMSTKGMKIRSSEFQNCTIANTKFEDCELRDVVFSLSDIRQCSAVRTKFENCRFERGTIDRVFFHQGIKAHGIEGLESMKITMGGATEQEVTNHARQIREALTNGTPDKVEVMAFKTPVRLEASSCHKETVPARMADQLAEARSQFGQSFGNEELMAALYKKVSAEQQQYKDWLRMQPPEDILRLAYEYSVREDIVASMEEIELSPRQVKSLLSSQTPLREIYQKFESLETDHMDMIWLAITGHANALGGQSRGETHDNR